MNNLAGSIIGLHDPNLHTIQFSANFIGRQNVSFGLKSNVPRTGSNLFWNTTIEYPNWSGTQTLIDSMVSIDNNGLLTYHPDIIEEVFAEPLHASYAAIAVQCRAYSADLDTYETLRFTFRYGQIIV